MVFYFALCACMLSLVASSCPCILPILKRRQVPTVPFDDARCTALRACTAPYVCTPLCACIHVYFELLLAKTQRKHLTNFVVVFFRGPRHVRLNNFCAFHPVVAHIWPNSINEWMLLAGANMFHCACQQAGHSCKCTPVTSSDQYLLQCGLQIVPIWKH